MDIYIVMDGHRVVGASAALQGAELLRVDEAHRLATTTDDSEAQHRRGLMAGWAITAPLDVEAFFYKNIRIVNTELQDAD